MPRRYSFETDMIEKLTGNALCHSGDESVDQRILTYGRCIVP